VDAQEGWAIFGVFFAGLVLAYFPIALVQMVLMVHAVSNPLECWLRKPVPGRRVVVMICTVGQSPSVVEWILEQVRSYGLPVRAIVIKEARDPFRYSAEQFVVPVDYTTPNHSRKKMRALQYGIEQLRREGAGKETYIVHLDDDSVVERDYLEHAFAMPEAAGQGVLRLREFGHHTLSSYADNGRVFNCNVMCRHFNDAGKPMEIHGEGLTLRADVEAEIGWDFGTYGAEDLMMGQSVVRRGYSFGLIPHRVYIAPPTTAKDFYLQRRRWMFSILWSVAPIREIRPGVVFWLMYRYVTNWTGFVGLIVLPLAILFIVPLDVPTWLIAISLFNTVSYFGSYVYGAGTTRPAIIWKQLLLQLPVAAFEGATVLWGALRPPNSQSFEVIQKV
jgi:cellulose synthase/poly-beta-1,6-N-acetylglucosamine synthase-like glycosyltransferase